MKRGSLIALGLSAGVVALALSTRVKRTDYGNPPLFPAPRFLYVERPTGLRDRPAEAGGVISKLEVGTQIIPKQNAGDGWILGSVVRPGLAPLEGYLKLADLSVTRPSPPPTPPGPKVERAYVERQTGLREQPAEGSGVVSVLAAGTAADVEPSATPAWVFASVVRPGLPPLEGYLKVADLTFTPPAQQLTQSGQLFDARLRPPGRIDIVRPQPPAPPLYEPYRPGRVITNVPDEARFLTGESVAGESSGAELARVLAAVDGPFKAMADYYERDWYPAKIGKARPDIPSRLGNVSQFRSFWDQASIVQRTLSSFGIKPTSSDAELRAAFRQSLTTRSVPGFSRHHWGTEIDVVAADSSAWRRGGPLEVLWPFVHEEAPRFGFYTPFREGFFPEPTKAHYNDEPWHLSYFPVASGLRERWLAEVDVPSLLIRVADTLSPGLGISRDRISAVLVTLDLPSYQENVVPSLQEART